VIKEEKSVFWEVIVSVIARKEVGKCLILQGSGERERELCEFTNTKAMREVIKKDKLLVVHIIFI
jgi:F0F1-type ATP synthase beta subunit